MKTYTLINDHTGETIETIDAQGFARWLAVDDLLEALEWHERADAEPEGSRREGCLAWARVLRRAAIAKATPDDRPG